MVGLRVLCEVVLHDLLVVPNARHSVADLVGYTALLVELVFVVAEVFEYRWIFEVPICCIVALTRTADTGQVLYEDLLLEAVWTTGNAREVV